MKTFTLLNENELVVALIIGLLIIIIPFGIYVHDIGVTVDHAHQEWYNAWKGGIAQENDCYMLKSMIDDEQGKWIKSELYPLVEKRLGELKC